MASIFSMINEDELCDVPICVNYHTDVKDFHVLSTLIDYDPLFCYECLETIELFDNNDVVEGSCL